MKNCRPHSHATKDVNDLAPLTEVRIDNLLFQVTWNPFEDGSCIIWMRDADREFVYNALGKFKSFDKRDCLEFMVRYSTSPAMREEIARRKFTCKMDAISPDFLRSIELMCKSDKEAAYRKLFDLDITPVGVPELTRRRRSMTKRFHPDVGGDGRAMSLINEAYDYLVKQMGAD